MQIPHDPSWKNADFANLRRSTLRLFLVFLVLTAVIAMVTVLVGDFGDFEIKVLLSTLTVSAASICAMSSFAYLQKGGDTSVAGTALVVKLVTAVLLIGSIWFEADDLSVLKLLGVLSTISVAFAHAFLLLVVELDERQRWVQRVGIALICVLAAMIAMAIVAEIDEEAYYRLLIVVAIAVTLFTLVIPIMGRMRKARGEAPTVRPGVGPRLVLEWGADGIYRDAEGRSYRVQPLETPTPGSPSAGGNPYG